MPIARNAGVGAGNRLKDPGEYRVKITETKVGMSKKGKPMLTVTFETHDEKQICGYFVKELAFHMHFLGELKLASGLTEKDSAENLVGKEVGILVEAQEPNEKGFVFMSIVGYGKSSEVDSGDAHFALSDTNIPF